MTSSNLPVVFVINPRSANGATLRRFERDRRLFENALGRIDVRLTESPGHATTITRELLQVGPHTIVSVGGDGTNNEVVNGFFDDDGTPIQRASQLSFYVSGTGGDFRRSLAWDTDAKSALRRVVDGKPRDIDVGRVVFRGHDGRDVSRMFLNIASFGLSGAVDEVVNRSSKALGAQASFAIGTMRAFMGFSPQGVRLTVGATTREEKISVVAVANGQYFGGGMWIAPSAVVDDGVFDIVTVGEVAKSFWLKNAAKVYGGKHIGLDGVRCVRDALVTAEPLHPSERVLIDIDGEQPGILPARFTVVPKALTILTA